MVLTFRVVDAGLLHPKGLLLLEALHHLIPEAKPETRRLEMKRILSKATFYLSSKRFDHSDTNKQLSWKCIFMYILMYYYEDVYCMFMQDSLIEGFHMKDFT